jgi:hypothetical protein
MDMDMSAVAPPTESSNRAFSASVPFSTVFRRDELRGDFLVGVVRIGETSMPSMTPLVGVPLFVTLTGLFAFTRLFCRFAFAPTMLEFSS